MTIYIRHNLHAIVYLFYLIIPFILVQRLLICCHLLRPKKTKLTILDDVSGVLKPGR